MIPYAHIKPWAVGRACRRPGRGTMLSLQMVRKGLKARHNDPTVAAVLSADMALTDIGPFMDAETLQRLRFELEAGLLAHRKRAANESTEATNKRPKESQEESQKESQEAKTQECNLCGEPAEETCGAGHCMCRKCLTAWFTNQEMSAEVNLCLKIYPKCTGKFAVIFMPPAWLELHDATLVRATIPLIKSVSC